MRWGIFAAALVVGCGSAQAGRSVVYAIPGPASPAASAPVVIERAPERKRDALSAVDTDVLRPKLVRGEVVLDGGAKAQQAGAGGHREVGAYEPAPEFLIRSARASSLVMPSVDDEWNREGSIWTYEYAVGRTYQVSSCEVETVRIELAPGEEITSQPRLGDSSGWTVSKPDRVGDNKGHQVWQLYLRPTTEDVGDRYLRFGTNLGAYRLHLVVLPQEDRDCMTDVRWHHADMELARVVAEQQRKQVAAAAEREEAAADRADTVGTFNCGDSDVNGEYSVELATGNPSWKPRVCHVVSGEHAIVHIELPRQVAWTQWPQLAVDGGSAGGCRMVREDYMFVCDNLFARAMLSLSARGEQEIYYIRRVIRRAP